MITVEFKDGNTMTLPKKEKFVMPFGDGSQRTPDDVARVGLLDVEYEVLEGWQGDPTPDEPDRKRPIRILVLHDPHTGLPIHIPLQIEEAEVMGTMLATGSPVVVKSTLGGIAKLH